MVYCTEELHEFKTKQGNYVMLYVNQTTLNDSLFFSSVQSQSMPLKGQNLTVLIPSKGLLIS